MSLRILLISPKFYGIEKEIRNELVRSGYEVEWIENVSLNLDYHAAKAKLKLLRFAYFLIFRPQVRYLKKKLSYLPDKRFDILFFINGHLICNSLLEILRKENSLLKTVLYLWDASSLYSWEKEFRYFDRVITFDPDDSKRYGINYIPNFYIEPKEIQRKNNRHDLFFAGKFSPQRLLALDIITEQFRKSEVDFYVKLWPAYKVYPHSRLLFNLLGKIKIKSTWIRNYIINYEAVEGIIKRDFIIKDSICFAEIQSHFMNSNVILDLQSHSQSGYSHRLIESLANGKKLITSNLNIRKEKFFNSEQIKIVDSERPDIDPKWIKDEVEFPVDNYFSSLELSAWLKNVLNA